MKKNDKTAPQTVADNVDRLMKTRDDTKSTLKLAKKARVGNGSIHRLRKAEGACTLKTLAAVAGVFGLEAWQLLIEDVDPDDRPQLMRRKDMERLQSDIERSYQERLSAAMKANHNLVDTGSFAARPPSRKR